MPETVQVAVYTLCAATSVACALMLYRGFVRSGSRFLLWCSLCFVGLTINNALLFIDLVVYPSMELSFLGISLFVWRSASALIGLVLLLIGLVWDAE